MVKNTTGGSKHKKYANKSSDVTQYNIKNLIKKGDEQMYAYIETVLGNCRFNVKCIDNKIRLAHVRGKLRKRSWCNQGDIVLISTRDFQDNKCDIIQKYNPDEVTVLIQYNEISQSFGKIDKSYIYDTECKLDQNQIKSNQNDNIQFSNNNEINNQSNNEINNQSNNYLNFDSFSDSNSEFDMDEI